MKISKKMQDAINNQINAELYSAYMYLSMSAYFKGKALDGMASWMKKQADEEVHHATKFFDFIYERAGDVALKAIATPPKTWKSALNAFEEAYKHEQKVTAMIHNLVNIADKEKDHATKVFLNWYVDEQVEEEDSALEIVDKLKMAGSSNSTLLMLDKVLGDRK